MIHISLALILPIAHVTVGNQIAIALGHAVDPDTYSVRLSDTGSEPATHMGTRTWATAGFVRLAEIVTSGVVPEGTAPGLAATALAVRARHPATMAALLWDRRDMTESADALTHWNEVLAANGLQTVVVPMP